MGRMLFVVAAFVLVVPAFADDASKLVGTWTVTSAEKNGKAETAADVKDKQVKITRDTITCINDGRTEMACEYTADTSRTPWQLTLKCTEGEHKGKTLKAIASLEGDTLKVCHAKPDKDAPTSFRTSDDQCCMTLKRER